MKILKKHVWYVGQFVPLPWPLGPAGLGTWVPAPSSRRSWDEHFMDPRPNWMQLPCFWISVRVPSRKQAWIWNTPSTASMRWCRGTPQSTSPLVKYVLCKHCPGRGGMKHGNSPENAKACAAQRPAWPGKPPGAPSSALSTTRQLLSGDSGDAKLLLSSQGLPWGGWQNLLEMQLCSLYSGSWKGPEYSGSNQSPSCSQVPWVRKADGTPSGGHHCLGRGLRLSGSVVLELSLLAIMGTFAMWKALLLSWDTESAWATKPVLHSGKGFNDRAWDTEKSFPSPFLWVKNETDFINVMTSFVMF